MSKILSLDSELSLIRAKRRNRRNGKSFGLEVPRGIKNNNPGNIEKNPANAWEGRVPLLNNTDVRFEQFNTYAYGVRALIMLLRTYINSGRNTITAIFSQYAPAGENNTQQYVNFVAGRLGISATATITLSKTVLRELAQAIAKMENGQECISDTQFEEGWNLLSTEVKNSIAQNLGYNSNSFSFQEGYSRPFFDTGEHALLGEYINGVSTSPISTVEALQPTKTYNINGVLFTYGQIITMADFFDNYNSMINANPAQLTALKNLIIQSENLYKNSILGIGIRPAPVSDSQWRAASPQYIDLALKNNSHFAPAHSGASVRINENNKLFWENYHNQAIQKARAGTSSKDLDIAYPINAFGDHFLTDAFSAGHLFNKEVIMQRFLSNCFSGNSLNSAADSMLEKVADGALRISAVKAELGRWETKGADWEWIAPGNGFDLDTQTPKIFYRVLKGILQDAAGRIDIANLAAKAVHDFLNGYPGGVPVKNNKGDSWNLSGDGTLNRKNIEVIQLAVKQSVENLSDSVGNSIPVSTFFKKIWDFVPNIDFANTKAIVENAINNLTNPSSSDLITKAISLIKDQLPILIDKLEKKGKIQKK